MAGENRAMSAPSVASPWIVTLVCGASGVGKSSVAVSLARRYGVPLAEADEIVTAVKALTTPEQAPMLHLWDTHSGSADADQRTTNMSIFCHVRVISFSSSGRGTSTATPSPAKISNS